jgi:ADP-dependent NAD(P)H-hydrate dehydratase / NAD(P)H-hydrate epimerase
MRRMEQAAMAAGTSGRELMERAGSAAAAEIVRRYGKRRTAVLCGPGNNGGDGLVVARHLQGAGWPISVSLMGERSALRGDAAVMAKVWQGETQPLSLASLEEVDLVVDALFGTGLARPLEGAVAEIVDTMAKRRPTVVALDIPSGIDGGSGRILGSALFAQLTVTFARKKPAHLLLPGKLHCGEVVVADIGIADDLLASAKPKLFENSEALWILPERQAGSHKYSAGHAVVVSGGPWNTGAARLAAGAAQRIGAGLVTVASPAAALPVNAAHLTSIMLTEADTPLALSSFLSDVRRNAVLLGPALGIGGETRAKVHAALASGRAAVLDADALTSFEDRPDELFEAVAALPRRQVVMTPHAGEFARVFGATEESKVDQARRAAARSGAVIVYKGADTVVASPDGTAVVNANAPPWLATAGSGDVLAGFVAGLLAQGMPAVQAAAAAVFIHGETAARSGPGLVAEDLLSEAPAVLRSLLARQNIIGDARPALL